MYDRQADTQADGGRQIYIQAGKFTGWQGDMQIKQAESCISIHADLQANRMIIDQDVGRQVYGQTPGLQART
jgi:hypothetical protein